MGGAIIPSLGVIPGESSSVGRRLDINDSYFCECTMTSVTTDPPPPPPPRQEAESQPKFTALPVEAPRWNRQQRSFSTATTRPRQFFYINPESERHSSTSHKNSEIKHILDKKNTKTTVSWNNEAGKSHKSTRIKNNTEI